jgi:uncharacterized protein YceH (UPF0502 family)
MPEELPICLSPQEARVLGSLIEKEIATPDIYPLTLNALTNACNQISSRDPVMSLDEQTIVRALDSLREKRLAVLFKGADSRVPKYAHRFGTNDSDLGRPEIAVMCVLLLRGPQTPGEIRGRTGRLHEFTSLDEVEAVLAFLAGRPSMPLVVKLPRQAGAKEQRYAHLLSGEPVLPPAPEAGVRPEPATVAVRLEDERMAKVEADCARLRTEVEDLRRQFAEFRKQFE